MDNDGYIKYSEFFAEIKKICNTFIGKEVSSVAAISDEISGYCEMLDWRNTLPYVHTTSNSIVYDRTDHDIDGINEYSYSANIGSMPIISYRVISDESSGIIKNIKVTNHIAKLNDWYLTDVSQGLDYMLAKKERKKIMAKNQKLQKQIEENDEKVNILEKIMRLNAWDKMMVHKDLNKW